MLLRRGKQTNFSHRLNKWNEKELLGGKNILFEEIYRPRRLPPLSVILSLSLCVYVHISQCTWYQYSNRKHSRNSLYHLSLSIFIYMGARSISPLYKCSIQNIKGVELGDTFEILSVSWMAFKASRKNVYFLWLFIRRHSVWQGCISV